MKLTVWSELHGIDPATDLPMAGGTAPFRRDFEAPLITVENTDSGLMLRTFDNDLRDTRVFAYATGEWRFVEVHEPPSQKIQDLMSARKREYEDRHPTGMYQ